MEIDKQLTNEAWKGGNSKTFIVVHHTARNTTHNRMVRFFKRRDYISVHYVVGQNGEITQLVREDDRAWHAGNSRWNGYRSLNNHSIGIEITSDGHQFTNKQRNAVHNLCRDIMQRNQIPPENVLRHADIAYPRGRKWDVGPNFYKPRWGDWKGFQRSLVKPDLEVPKNIREDLEKKYEAQAKKLNSALDKAEIELHKLNKIRRDLATAKGVPYKPHTLQLS